MFHIENGDIPDLLTHPTRNRYPDQRLLVANVDGNAHLVPFVEDEQKVFLKTIIPSRKATRDYPGRFTMSKLKKDEKELLDSVEAGEWQSVPDREKEIKRYQKYASATFKKDRRINIRVSSKDLDALQKRALREGIPYQTLVASVLHKYLSGQYRDTDA